MEFWSDMYAISEGVQWGAIAALLVVPLIYYGGTYLLAGGGGVATLTELVASLPVISTIVHAFNRFQPQIQGVIQAVGRFFEPVSRVLSRPLPGLTQLNNLPVVHSIMRTPDLNGVGRTVTAAYGAVSIGNVLIHAGDPPGTEPAPLPGEQVLGPHARTALGVYGTFSISHLIGSMIFGLSFRVVSFFTLGLIASEYRVQHNSNAISFSDIDWTRVHGSATSAMALLGPMNWLWNGIGPWAGWRNLFPPSSLGPLAIPSARSIAGFVLSSGLLNSALFVPIALWLERANLSNFYKGLTLREFTLSVPRKILQAIFNPNSIPGVLAYQFMKVFENEIISRYFSLFAGTGLYRKPLHDFLAEEHTTEEFIEFCLVALASCRILLCETHEMEEDDFELIKADILRDEFTEEELGKITVYVDDLLERFKDPDSQALAHAWQDVFRHLNQ